MEGLRSTGLPRLVFKDLHILLAEDVFCSFETGGIQILPEFQIIATF